jgi:hypothetical protein
MSLLDHGKKLIREREEKEDKAQREKEALYDRLNAAARDRLDALVDTLKELRTKRKSGKRFTYKKDSGNCLRLFLGDEEIAIIMFGFEEGLNYDNDGGAWGSGDYYPSDRMLLKCEHKDQYGYPRPKSDRFETFYKDHLAVYLVQILE